MGTVAQVIDKCLAILHRAFEHSKILAASRVVKAIPKKDHKRQLYLISKTMMLLSRYVYPG